MKAHRAKRNAKLGDIAEVLPGYQFRQKLRHNSSGAVMVLQPGDVRNGSINFRSLDRVDETGIPERCFAQENDVALLSRGLNNVAAPVGATPSKLVVTNYFYILRPKGDDLLPAFLCWCLSQNFARRIIERERRGSRVPLIPKAALADISIPLPPIEKQKAISELVDLSSQEQSLLSEIGKRRKTLLESQIIQTLGVVNV